MASKAGDTFQCVNYCYCKARAGLYVYKNIFLVLIQLIIDIRFLTDKRSYCRIRIRKSSSSACNYLVLFLSGYNQKYSSDN